MATFTKKSVYFQLKHTNINFFAGIGAKEHLNHLHFNTQVKNIRIKSLNLSKNLKISNIFNKQNVFINTNSKNLIIYNAPVIYLLKIINKKTPLSLFLIKYFEHSIQTLNTIFNFHLNYNTTLFYNLNFKENLLNNFITDKLNSICFYQYQNTVLNNKTSFKFALEELFLNNFWLNISLQPNYFFKKTFVTKFTSNYLNNRNLLAPSTKIIQKTTNNALSLNTLDNLIIKNTFNFFFHKPFVNYLNIPKNYIYTILCLEEKIQTLQKSQDDNNLKKLKNFYNFLLEILKHNTNKKLTTNFILGNTDNLTKIKNLKIDFFIAKTIKQLTKTSKQQNHISFFFNQLKKSLYKKHSSKRFYNEFKINKYQATYRVKLSKNFSNKKLELITKYNKANCNKQILTTVLQQNTKIFYINALALTKFGFLLEKKSITNQNLITNPNKFLANLDREMISKYKYIGVYIKDLIRVAFIALFLKKPAFLVKFIAFQLNVLPKNRKETTFIRFIIKLVKTFAAEREEIWGLRLKFKGRVNRWRRTKVILGQRGILPLHTMSNRIEYGSAQGVNRKGAVGVHLWIWYNPIFKTLLKNTYKKYFIYSKYLKYKKLIND